MFNSAVSLPRLVNFDWRVDVKTASDSAARMAQPTCIVQMKVSATSCIGWIGGLVHK